MLRQRLTATAMVAAALVGSLASAAGKDPLAPIIAGIAGAQDPSAAVELYARGVSIEPNSAPLKAAYIRRMASFGMAQAAYCQARSLVESDPTVGVAWAVIADTAARYNMMPGALWAMAKAVRYSPADEFVLGTAGQVLAWYDSVKPVKGLSHLIAIDAENARAAVGNSPLYAQIYAQTAAALEADGELARGPEQPGGADGIQRSAPQGQPRAAAAGDAGRQGQGDQRADPVIEQTTIVNNTYYEGDDDWIGGYGGFVDRWPRHGSFAHDRDGHRRPGRVCFVGAPLPLKPAFAEPREWHFYRYMPNHLGGDKPIHSAVVGPAPTAPVTAIPVGIVRGVQKPAAQPPFWGRSLPVFQPRPATEHSTPVSPSATTHVATSPRRRGSAPGLTARITSPAATAGSAAVPSIPSPSVSGVGRSTPPTFSRSSGSRSTVRTLPTRSLTPMSSASLTAAQRRRLLQQISAVRQATGTDAAAPREP